MCRMVNVMFFKFSCIQKLQCKGYTRYASLTKCWMLAKFSFFSLSLSFCTFMGRDQFNKYDKNKQGQFSNLRGTFDHLQTSGVLLLNHSGTICLLTLDRSMMWISLNLNWRPFFLSEFMNYLRFFILYFCDYVYIYIYVNDFRIFIFYPDLFEAL